VNTPVILLIFNRPELTRRVFAEIAKARPTTLVVVADGPRHDRPDDAERCAAARAVVEHVDWTCEVLKNYSDVNMGCGRRESSGLIWALRQVEEAIVLEDDTLPHPSFFRFCEELLKKYRTDERVMHVSGNNYQLGRTRGPYSYYFSRYQHVWGYATWWRAFQHYDFDMKLWPVLRRTPWLLDILGDKISADWWQAYFDLASKGDRTVYDSYDCQWMFSIWAQNGLCVTPNVNLVSNIGFGPDATHTRGDSPLRDLASVEMPFPLEHPPHMVRDREADGFAFNQACAAGKKRGLGLPARVWRGLSGILPKRVVLG